MSIATLTHAAAAVATQDATDGDSRRNINREYNKDKG